MTTETPVIPKYGRNALDKPMTAECTIHHGPNGCCWHCLPVMFRPCLDHDKFAEKERRRLRE